MRTYEPIWKALKARHKVTVQVPKPMHWRIIKAVRKEKYMDKGWAFYMLDKGKVYKLLDSSTDSTLTFELQDVSPVIYLI